MSQSPDALALCIAIHVRDATPGLSISTANRWAGAVYARELNQLQCLERFYQQMAAKIRADRIFIGETHAR